MQENPNDITFRKDGRAMRINAALELPKTIWSKHKLSQSLKRQKVVFAVILRRQASHDTFELNSMDMTTGDKDIQNILVEYEDVFPDDVSKGLPPDRGRPRFKIELVKGAEPHKKSIHRHSEAESQELLR